MNYYQIGSKGREIIIREYQKPQYDCFRAWYRTIATEDHRKQISELYLQEMNTRNHQGLKTLPFISWFIGQYSTIAQVVILIARKW